MEIDKEPKWKEAVDDEESVASVLSAMGEFQQRFCDHMIANRDFTLALEIHGDDGKVLHVRFRDDSFRRPRGNKNSFPKGSVKKFTRD